MFFLSVLIYIRYSVKSLKNEFGPFYDVMTAPASKVLDKWFESEPLKATLATDSVIGAMISPHHTGSGSAPKCLYNVEINVVLFTLL